MEAGLRFIGGRPLLGPFKTVRGVAACMLCAPALGFPVAVGALAGAAAMGGDALSSFVKRRLAAIASAFVLLEIPVARLSYRLGLRDRPY